MPFLDSAKGFVDHCSTALQGLSDQETAKISFRLFVQERRMSARSWRLQRQETEQIAELEFIVQHIKVYCDDHTQDVSKQDMATTRLEGARFLPIGLQSLSEERPSSWNFAADLVKNQNCTNRETCPSSASSLLTSKPRLYEWRNVPFKQVLDADFDSLRKCAKYQTWAGSAGWLARLRIASCDLFAVLRRSWPEANAAAAAATAAAAALVAAAAAWPPWGLLF